MKKRLVWDAESIAALTDLHYRKVSLARTAVILKRPQSSIQIQSRKLGFLFPGIRATTAALKASIADAEALAGIHSV